MSMEEGKEDITSFVAAEFRKWGNTIPFIVADPTVPSTKYVPDIPDTERRLKWLSTSVASSIERISADCSEEQILRALGIWYTPMKPRVPEDGTESAEENQWQ
jgi:hypothetical protein